MEHCSIKFGFHQAFKVLLIKGWKNVLNSSLCLCLQWVRKPKFTDDNEQNLYFGLLFKGAEGLSEAD